MKRYLMLVLLLVALLLGVACSESSEVPETPDVTPTAERVFQEYENEFAFDMLYPEGWRSDLIREGLILFADPRAVADGSNTPERSLLVFRRLFDVNRSFEENFETYIESGPLSSGYVSELGILPYGLADGDGRQILLTTDPALDDGRPDLTIFIAAVQAESEHTYVLTATAPTAEWETWWPIFRVMLGSFTLNE